MMWNRRQLTQSQVNVLGKELVRQTERYLRRYERDIRTEVTRGMEQINDLLALEASL